MSPAPPYYDVYELESALSAAGPAEGTRACRMLPFVAVPPGRLAPHAPIVARHVRYPRDRVLLLLGIDHLIADGVDVINCSLGFQNPYDPADPIARAVCAAVDAGICFVAAAGNFGPREGSMQELALAPWVISVGATTPDGQPLASSSRGSGTIPGPTVVADGTSYYKPRFNMVVDFTGTGPGDEPKITHAFPPMEAGTSFAAPVVSRQAAFIRKVLDATALLLMACAAANSQPSPGPVRLPVVGLLDTGFDPDFAQETEFGPLSRKVLASGRDQVVIDGIETEREWCRHMTARLPILELPVSVDAVRRALKLMAQPLPADPWIVGAGLISDSAAQAFCAGLTPSRLLAVLAPRTLDALAPTIVSDLDDSLGPLWSEERVSVLADLFRSGVRFSIAKIV